MALGSLNLRVSKEDFINCIDTLEMNMQRLQDVIQRYEEAKKNTYKFIEEGDDNYEAMLENIEVNVMNAKNAYASLQEMKADLQNTVDSMEGMSTQISDTIKSATDATKSTVTAAIKAQTLL